MRLSQLSSCSGVLILAGNDIFQDLLDWIELGGVDEGVGAAVEKCHEERHVVAAIDERFV